MSLFRFLQRDTQTRVPPPQPPEIRVGAVVYLRIVLSPGEASRTYECFITVVFLRRGAVSTSPNPQAGGPPPSRLSATAYSIYSQLPSIEIH
jgi:hypothetical protein